MFEINSLSQLSKEIRYLIASFIVVLSIGFFSSISFVNHSNSIQPNGLVEQYNGNESDIDADVMKFKKSKRELLTIIHSHILSMSVIFFIVGLLLCLTPTNIFLKYFCIF